MGSITRAIWQRRSALALAGFAVLVLAPAVQARRVVNPTRNLAATATAISFDIAKGTRREQHGLLGGLRAALFSGATITRTGTLTIPASRVAYPPLHVSDRSGKTSSCPGCGQVEYSVTNMTLRLVPARAVTGDLDPFTGAATLAWHAYFVVHYHLHTVYRTLGLSSDFEPRNCTIGSSASPLAVTYTTGRTAPPAGAPNAPVSGTPYNQASGSLALVNDTLALPASSGDCSPTLLRGLYTFSLDDFLGLPSPSGYNSLAAALVLQPVIHGGVPPTGATPPSVTTVSKVKTSRSAGRIVVNTGQSVHCPRGAAPCAVLVTVTTRGTLGTIAVAHKVLRIAGGASKLIRFILTRRGHALLRRRQDLPVRVTVTATRASTRPLKVVMLLTLHEPPRRGHRRF